ncbi:LysR family transcriptional regulator [Micromonospora sp. KC606]|uniref:LysR family transcriptional regulator n=1 Tax=Micromonospora sp. KC606 TaxID=2530379 RepID=UPI001404316C|nr:LysR family transcriptional regulator [Micromonospora sp. KC606]
MFDLRRLRLLSHFASLGTVSAVARSAQLTPSAVSQQLAALEKEIGMPLLERKGRQLTLTEAGRMLVSSAERIFGEVERAETELAHLRNGNEGAVRLATFPSVSRLAVPQALAFCLNEGRPVEIGLHEMEAHESLPALRRGEIDLALVDEYDPLPALVEPGIEFTSLFSEQMYLVLPTKHPLARPDVLIAEFAADPWITCQVGTLCHAGTVSACAAAGFVPEIAYMSNDFTVILAMIEAGLGIGFVPAIAITQTRYDVRCLALTERPLRRRISVAVRSAARSRPTLLRMINAFTTVTADLEGVVRLGTSGGEAAGRGSVAYWQRAP